MPRTGEARRNPLYALKVALQKDGVDVQSRRRLQLLASGKEPAVPLGCARHRACSTTIRAR